MRKEKVVGESKIAIEKSLKRLDVVDELLSNDSLLDIGNKTGRINSLSILTIPQVAAKLNLHSTESAKRWLERQGILIHRFSKQNVVYEIEVICEIDKPFVRTLKFKYPSKWKKIYRHMIKDQNAYELLLLQIEGESGYGPTTKVRRNRGDDKLYNELMK